MGIHGNPDAKERQAREVADYLHSIGQSKRANDVLTILRACKSARTTASVLARDVKALRQNGVWCVFCDMVVHHEEAAACKRTGCTARAILATLQPSGEGA